MPEIALTAQFLDRFAGRFGARPAEWHSGDQPTQARAHLDARRRRARRGSSSARARRCSCRLAISRLIVVDEEHEGAYKQEDGVNYHARDMAVVRARIEGATLVLASATPSIETRVNADQRPLCASAAQGARRRANMPRLEAIDMRVEGPPHGRWIAPRLALRGGRDARARRTGAAVSQPARLCAADAVPRLRPSVSSAPIATPGWSSIASGRALVCHHCGHIGARPHVCPECEAADALARLRPRRRASCGRSGGAVSRRPRARAVVGFSRRRRAAAARIGRRSPRALSISSSARSSSPRVIIFPF